MSYSKSKYFSYNFYVYSIMYEMKVYVYVGYKIIKA